MHLRTMQLEARAWRAKNFPAADPRDQALGVCEEAGEIAHHVLKLHQGIRGDSTVHLQEIEDGLGDLIIFASGLADCYDLDLQNCVMNTWAKVRQRDWIADPERGGEDDHPPEVTDVP